MAFIQHVHVDPLDQTPDHVTRELGKTSQDDLLTNILTRTVANKDMFLEYPTHTSVSILQALHPSTNWSQLTDPDGIDLIYHHDCS